VRPLVVFTMSSNHLLPPAYSPLRLQSRVIRETLLEDHAAYERGKNSLFQRKPHCPHGHKLVAQAAPVRVGCSQCRAPLNSAAGAYCCAPCGGRDWLCAQCIVWHEHVMRASGAPSLSPPPQTVRVGASKLRYNQVGNLQARQHSLQVGRETALLRLDQLALGSPDKATRTGEYLSPTNRVARSPARLVGSPGAPLASPLGHSMALSPLQQRAQPSPGGASSSPSKRRPRKHLPATPKSMFKTNDPVLAKTLGFDPPQPLEARRASLQQGAAAVREFAEASLELRQQQHDAILLKYFRSLDGGSEISSEVSSSTEENNTARDGAEEGANPDDEEEKDDEDAETSMYEDRDANSGDRSSEEEGNDIGGHLRGADDETEEEEEDEEL